MKLCVVVDEGGHAGPVTCKLTFSSKKKTLGKILHKTERTLHFFPNSLTVLWFGPVMSIIFVNVVIFCVYFVSCQVSQAFMSIKTHL